MSKEIAQTVGGKRIAWLIAIVAAFAVFATVGSQFRSADATVTTTAYRVYGPLASEPETAAQCESFANAADVPYGNSVYYCIISDADATIANPLNITFQLPASLEPGSIYVDDVGPVTSNCEVVGNSWSCTLDGLTGTSTFMISIEAVVLGDVADNGNGVCNANEVCVLLDDPSGPLFGEPVAAVGDNKVALNALVSSLSLTKTRVPAGAVGANTNVTMIITATCNDTTDDIACANVQVTDVLDSDWASIQSVTPSQGSCVATGTGSLPTFPSLPFSLTCSLGNIAETASATVNIVATTPAQPAAGESDVVITNTATATQTSGPNPAPAVMAQITVAAAAVVLQPLPVGLHHLDPFGVPLFLSDYDETCRLNADGQYDPEATLDTRDDCNNLIGYVHEVCLVTDISIRGATFQVIETLGGLSDDYDYFWRIQPIAATPAPTVSGQATFVNTEFNGLFTNGDNLNCVRWYSVNPGEQDVTLVDSSGSVVANWHGAIGTGQQALNQGTNGDLQTVLSYTPLVKEWNVLEPTWITLRGNTTTNLDGTTLVRPTAFNAAEATYNAPVPVRLDEHVFGSHQSIGGPVGPVWVDGARVTFTILANTCGMAVIDPDGDTTLEGGPFFLYHDDIAADRSVTVTSVGVPINFDIDTYECTSLDQSSTTVTIQAAYPTSMASIARPLQELETITVDWVSTVPVKPIILAWAGQRVIIEHDWRIAPGDTMGAALPGGRNTYTPAGACVFGQTSTFPVIAVRGSGPGNFIAALGASTNNLRDTATVNVSTDNYQSGDAPSSPQGACISRFLYESEDPGQVDIEMFVENENSSTKVAVVIYYMKIEAVNTSLVTSVEKPNHNATGGDFAPGNPWNTENDVTATEWNVSKDLLVRVSVKGWFVNANPSGRERDASDPFNVLPQDRWVMPDDWGILIGGGAGIDFRPEYDYMFAPNSGVSLTTPEGVGAQVGATATAASAGTVINVSAATPFAVGQTVTIGTSCTATVTRTITAVDTVNNRITVNAATVVAEGNVVCYSTGVPFEGPHSLIDIQGRAPLFGGAALSNYVANNIRDTRLGDNRLDWWDAPMPSTPITVDIRGAGFIKQVLKQDVYYIGTPNSTAQVYPNPYYITNIPESPYISSSAGGGSFLWNSWGNDGPGGNGDGVYRFWNPVRIGVNIAGNPGETLTANQQNELKQIRAVYGDDTIARRLVVFSDNHGEAMVIANGDFNLDYADCPVNALAGGRHCNQGDVVGSSDIYATADYPDFRGKHFPVRGPVAEVDWTWGGYKAVTIEPGEVEQFVYVVFRALDRDGFCVPPAGAVSLHPVHTPTDIAVATVADAAYNFPNASGVGPTAQIELVDFMIDSDEGGIFIETSGGRSPIGVTREFADGVPTYSTADANRSLTAQNDLRKFAPINDSVSECQAWVKISNSLLGVTNVLVIAANDEGNVGFDVIVDFQSEIDYTLNFRWSLITWTGADNISPIDALSGTGNNAGGTNILDQVTAVYGWEASSQSWLAFFPDGIDVPGANDLTGLRTGHAYWIAIRGPQSITWTVVTNVNN